MTSTATFRNIPLPTTFGRDTEKSSYLSSGSWTLALLRFTSLHEFDSSILKRPDLNPSEEFVLDKYKWLHAACATPPIPYDDDPLRDLLVDPQGISFPSDGGPPPLSLCSGCHSFLKNKTLPPLSLANRNFGSVPEELRNLTVIEKAMIARCRSKCWIIQLKEENQDLVLASTQRGVKGHIIIYPQQPSSRRSCSGGTHERKIGDTYDPDLLPDHRGSYFDHRVSKLVQRDHRDEDEKLRAPHELYSQLTEGTLFCARICSKTFIFKGDRASKVYHIYVERLQVLDKGLGNAWSPPVPSLLAESAPSTPRKRTREEPEADGAVDDAFDSFKGISPKKKGRTSA
ncbi:hypothetical protein DFH09DRAFT_1368480, partial [Mycena vulgaris]